MRWGLAMCLGGAALLTAFPVQADEAIARRLAALQALVDPESARAAARHQAAKPGGGAGGAVSGCLQSTWWRATSYGVRSRTERAIRDASLRFGIDTRLIRSVIRHESNYDPRAVSPVGAMGLMQLMPGTARELGVVCPFDPRENVLGGTRYLSRMYRLLGTWPRAVAAYHAGPGNVRAGRIPSVTRRYVTRVLRTWSSQRFATIHLD